MDSFTLTGQDVSGVICLLISPNGLQVYDYSRKWKCDGTMAQIHDALRRQLRIKSGRHPEPSAARIDSEFVKKPKGFQVLPKRWVVERTFAWIGLHRRHSKDYETLPEQSEFFIRVSMTRNMLRRLTA